MDLTYKTKELQKFAEGSRFSIRKLGPVLSGSYTKRITQLLSAQTLEDVRHQPGNFHELTGDRKGQWACNLDANNRLVFEPHENPIPTDPDGRYMWCEIKGVEITEVVDYH